MDTQSNTPAYLDKNLYALILAMVLPPIAAKTGLSLDAGKIAALMIPVVAYIVTHGIKSGKVLLAELEARAKTAITVDPVVVVAPAAVKP